MGFQKYDDGRFRAGSGAIDSNFIDNLSIALNAYCLRVLPSVYLVGVLGLNAFA